MSRRYLYAAAGIVALVAALVVPVASQPRWGGGWGCWGATAPAAVGPVNLEGAADRVRQVLSAWGNTDLAVKEVMEFSNHFYVLVVERSTGRGAMELIVERNGVVRPEPGPNMMWNLRYGHMGGAGGGMMGGWGMMGPGWGGGWRGGPGWVPPQAGQPLTVEQAREAAARFLQAAFPGLTPDEHGTAFYGYFTFDVERAGRTVGMLSVNAFTGQVWYHTWHGEFIREREF